MNFRIIHFFALFLVIVASPPIIPAAEVYMWVDDRGVRHITDQPPEKPAKMIGKETYKRDSPEEIRRYQLEQERVSKIREQETEINKQRGQYQEPGQNRGKQNQKESEVKRAKEDLEFEEKYQERYGDKRRNAKPQWEIDMYDNLKKDQDKKVEEKRRKLQEAENR